MVHHDTDNRLNETSSKIAGAICGDLFRIPVFKDFCLILSAGITYKVKVALQKHLSKEGQDIETAVVRDVQNAVISLLFLYEIDPMVVSAVAPGIEASIRRVLPLEI